ncbi:MAG: DUF1501 domain-containing protein [Pirellulales bacterium]|nr:DUF1501 domain-containing protein [Pirellulales bacterium]
MLWQWANGFGGLALLGLSASAQRLAVGATPASQADSPATDKPVQRAKHVIFLYMDGGPSQMDMFDPKPRLTREHGQPIKIPIVNRMASNTVMKSPFRFARHGECGADVCELLPNIARHVDDLTIIRSMVADNMEHAAANLTMLTGAPLIGRPSIGSWISYGLGTESEDLPGYMVMHGGKLPHGGAGVFGQGFLPTEHQCALFSPREAKPFGSIERWEETVGLQQAKLDALAKLHQLSGRQFADSPVMDAMSGNYELAFRMQASLPDLLSCSDESAATEKLYGLDDPNTETFGRQCLLARRMVERGVRFITLVPPVVKADRWDQHDNLEDGLRRNCLATDRAIGGLLTDLKARGLLDHTLVIWGGEFGRAPTAELSTSRRPGREHNPFGFTMWLAGGGAKRGLVYGATDEYGYRAIEKPVHVHDLHATVLHLLGIDHTRLTFRYGGRDYRLTDVYGNVVHELLL